MRLYFFTFACLPLPSGHRQTQFLSFPLCYLPISSYSRTLIAVSAQKRLEVKSSAIVVLTALLDSPNLPKEGLSGLKGKFSWRDT